MNENIVPLVASLTEQEFWGNLTLKFQRGQVVHITKEESIQPVPNNRSVNGKDSQRSQ